MNSYGDEGQDYHQQHMELFIDEVRKNEVLWNEFHTEYRNRKAKKCVWSRVGAKFNIKSHQAQIKWKNLRDRYKKHKKELQAPGSEQTITRVWYLYKFLTFIDSGCASTSGPSNVNQPSESSQTNDDTNDGNLETNVCSLEEINVKQERCTPDLSNDAEDLNTFPCDTTPSTSQPQGRAGNSHIVPIMPVIQDEGQDVPLTQMEVFIEEVRNNELLWNELNPKYKNRKAKERTWLRIGATFNMKPQQAQRRWKNLRDRYKKIKKELQTPENDQTMSRIWYLYKYLTFLDSDCPSASRLSIVNPPSESSQANDDSNDGNSETNICSLEEINVKEEYCTTPDLFNDTEDHTDNTLPCDMSPSTSQSEDRASSCVAQFMPMIENSYEDEAFDLAPQMEWFIEEVKNNEVLWNRFNPDYRNRKLKERLWFQIAAKFNIKSQQAQTRWKNLQDRYKKIKREMQTPGNEQPTKVPWYLYKFLTFLDNGCPSTPGSSNVNPLSDSSKTNEDTNDGTLETNISNVEESNVQQGSGTSEQWCIGLNTLQYNMNPSIIQFGGGLLVIPPATVTSTPLHVPSNSHVAPMPVPILPAPVRMKPAIDEEHDLLPTQMELFIEDVRNNEILWNKLNPDFKNQRLKDRIWLRVGAKYKMRPHQARRRWKNLQDRFKKTKKELQNPGSEQTITRVWYLYKFLTFLDPSCQPTRRSSNVNTPSESSKANEDTNGGGDSEINQIIVSKLEESKVEQECDATTEQWCIDLNTMPSNVTPSTSKATEGPFSAQTAVTGTTVKVPSNSCAAQFMPGMMNLYQEEGLDFPTSEMELFIEDVKNNEILWNRSNPDYKKKRVKDSIWLRVGAKYKMRPSQARCRWKNLQDRYKKFKKELQSLGSEQTITRVWYLYKFLKFLDRRPTTFRSSKVKPPSQSTKINDTNEDNLETNTLTKLEEITVKEERCTTPDLSDNFVDITTLMCDVTPSTSQSEGEPLMLPTIEVTDATMDATSNSVNRKWTEEAMDCSETQEHQNTTKDEDALLASHLDDLKSFSPKMQIEVSTSLHSGDATSPDMPTVCCVRHCKHSHLNCGLHNFPNDTWQQSQWVANIKKYDKNFQLKKHHRVCNCHFANSYFIEKETREGKKQKKLSVTAVPTRFPVPGSDVRRAQPAVQPDRVAKETQKLSRRNDVLKVKQFLSQNMSPGNAVVLTSNAPQDANPAWLSQLPPLAPKPKFFQPQSTESSQSSSVVLCPPVMPTLTSSASSSMPSTSKTSGVTLQNNALSMDQQSSLGFLIPVKPYGNNIFAPTTSQDAHSKSQVAMPLSIVSSIPLQNRVVIQPSTSNMSASSAAASSSRKSGAVQEEVYLPVSDTEEVHEEFDDDETMPLLQGLCRICAEAASVEGKQMIEIFGEEGRARNIPDLIMQYLPIEVLETDRLPLKVCTACVSTLETCHELILKCKLGDATLRRLLAHEENREASPIPCFDDICESFLQEGPQKIECVEDMKDNTEVAMIKCTYQNCKHQTRNAIRMIRHVATKHKKRACSICWKHFNTFKERNKHKVEIHEGMLLCDLCGDSYLGRKGLQAHMENHVAHSERRYKCKICGKGFSKSSELKLHSSRHSKSKTLKCPKCDKMFYHANDVKIHMQIHAEKGSFKCKQCLRSFTCKRYLALHEAKYHVEKWIYKCKTCDYSASKLKVLAEHCQKEHGINTDQLLNNCDISSPFQCETCKTYFSNIMNLKEHKGKFHGSCKVRPPRKNIFSCEDCGDLFLSQIQCTYHAKYMHGDGSESVPMDGQNLLECATCARKFSTKSYLIQHMESHKVGHVKPYQCQYCVSSFATLDAHADHERVHRGETPYQCSYCPQKFPSSKVLERHTKSHTKPLICQYCGKRFAMKFNLTMHQRVHTGERPYKCKFCEKAYKQKPEMEFHQLTHSMEKKYKCSICNFGDNKKKLVIAHVVTEHGIEANIDDVVIKHNFS